MLNYLTMLIFNKVKKKKVRKKVAEQGTGYVKGEGKGRGQVFAGLSLMFDVYKEP